MTKFMLQPPPAVSELRELLKRVANEWQNTVNEPIPQKWLDLLARLK